MWPGVCLAVSCCDPHCRPPPCPVGRPSDVTLSPPVGRPSDATLSPPVGRPYDVTLSPPVSRPSDATLSPPVGRPSDVTLSPPVGRPSHRLDESLAEDVAPLLVAERRGREVGQCHLAYPRCPLSLFNVIDSASDYTGSILDALSDHDQIVS